MRSNSLLALKFYISVLTNEVQTLNEKLKMKGIGSAKNTYDITIKQNLNFEDSIISKIVKNNIDKLIENVFVGIQLFQNKIDDRELELFDCFVQLFFLLWSGCSVSKSDYFPFFLDKFNRLGYDTKLVVLEVQYIFQEFFF